MDANDTGQISADELLGSSMLLFIAGITTTSGLISNSVLHLDRFPDQRDFMRDGPSGSSFAMTPPPTDFRWLTVGPQDQKD